MVDPVSAADFKVMFLNETPIVQVPARISVLEAVALKKNFQELLQENSPPVKIIFDFSQTTFIDSSGIGALVSNHKSAAEKEVQMILKGVLPPVLGVLEMTGLDKILSVEPLDISTVKTTGRLEPRPLPTTHPSLRSWLKRFIDIVGGTVGLGITALVLIPIAIAIKLDSPGPIFFCQTRLGWMGKQFRIWKFRSMFMDAEARLKELEAQNEAGDNKIFKLENDPRITPVGKFLRRTSLDELPQFWNVIRGEMSLVGTRPPTPNEVEIYEVPEWQRLDVKPGMTGEWQVNGRAKITPFEEIIQWDLQYQRNWSLTHDLKLILQTILVVFRREGK